jgi:putative inorganic carbon (HCO3(-)) transporter
MRDLFLVAVVAFSLGLTLRYPFIGVLIWEWFSLMAPHQQTFGFARSLPLNLAVAVITFASWLASAESKKIPRNAITKLSIIFLIWMTLNSFFAYDTAWSWPYWDRTWRIFALGFLIAAMATNRVRIEAVIWVAAISLMYYGVKGGIFTVVTGGANKVLGPDSTIIGDNNQLALALLMTLPLIEYLRSSVNSKLLSFILLGCIIATTMAVLGSYSRGAYIAMAAIALFFLLHTRRRFLYIAIGAVVIIPALRFMPQEFVDRINTLNSVASVSADGSFQGRLMAWQVAFRYATEHFPFGAGFYGPQLSVIFHQYFPGVEAHAAHSIYFQVLGENGFIGLILYLSIMVSTFSLSVSIIRRPKTPETLWAQRLARMIQISLIAFAVGGAALSMAYYDLFVVVAFLLPNIALETSTKGISAKWKVGSEPQKSKLLSAARGPRNYEVGSIEYNLRSEKVVSPNFHKD